MTLPELDPPTDLAMAQPFWDAIARNELALPRCSVCNTWQWYPELDGTDCSGGHLVWETVATTGTVYSFTRVHRSFLPGGRDHVPYVVGLIELDDVDGPHLVANLDDWPELAVGARVRARFTTIGARRHPVFEPAPMEGSSS